MISVTVYPVEGRLVLLPGRNFAPIPEEGARVPLDQHIQKALKNGDLVLSPAEVPASVPAPQADSAVPAAKTANTSK